VEFTQPVPDFSIADLSGRLWRLEDLRGKGILINFGATWCGPCRGEHAELQKLHDSLKGPAESMYCRKAHNSGAHTTTMEEITCGSNAWRFCLESDRRMLSSTQNPHGIFNGLHLRRTFSR
jgi:thiol-disulfide isomerase/thioredoxin